MFEFNKGYFLLSVLLFVTEVLIALYVNDSFVRPYAGDFLVVILLYCTVRSFIAGPVLPAAIGVLLFAYLIELSQYFHLDRLLGLEHSPLAQTIMGQLFFVGGHTGLYIGNFNGFRYRKNKIKQH